MASMDRKPVVSRSEYAKKKGDDMQFFKKLFALSRCLIHHCLEITASRERQLSKLLTGRDIVNIDNICEYLDLLYIIRKKYTILLVIRGKWAKYAPENTAVQIMQLGSKKNNAKILSENYIGIFQGGKAIHEDIIKNGIFFYKNNKFEVKSTFKSLSNFEDFLSAQHLKSGIIIDDEIVIPESNGVSIVVYDEEVKKVIDAVCFNTELHTANAFRPLSCYNVLLEKISELHGGIGYTVSQWLVDNKFTTITLCIEPQFTELIRASVLPMKMNSALSIKGYFTSSSSPLKFEYSSNKMFLAEKYIPFNIAMLTKGDCVVHISPFPDLRLQQAIQSKGCIFFGLTELIGHTLNHIRSGEIIIRKLMAETPGLKAISLQLPKGEQDTSAERTRCANKGMHRGTTIKSLKKGKRNSKRVSAYIRKDKEFSTEDWLEVLRTPKAYNDERGYRKFHDTTGKHLNIVNGHRLTVDVPEPYDNTIYIFGGCRVFGVGCSDRQTLASHLQKLLNADPYGDKVYCVENYGHFLARHYSDYLRVILSIKPKAGDIIIFQGNPHVKRLNLDFTQMKLPTDYGHLFWDSKHNTTNLNRFMAERIYAFLKEEVFNEDVSVVQYNTRQIPLCGLQVNAESENDLPLEYRKRLSEYKTELRKIRAGCIGRIGSIVMNCNPFTLGHRFLIEHAARNVKHLFIFVVEEDKSFFSFKDRFELVKTETANFDNVTVLASGQFIISALTFSDYFQKETIQDREINPSQDIELFAKEIAPALGISVRFVGEEPLDAITHQYNKAMLRIFPRYGIECEVVARKKSGEEVISASRVRKLFAIKDYDEIAKLVPESTLSYLKGLYVESAIVNEWF